MKPTDTFKIKTTVKYNFINGSTYFIMFGSALEIKDSKKFIFSLCSLLNGENTILTIKQKLQEEYPGEITYLENAITALDNAYILENVILNIPSKKLSEYDLKRWSRNIEFFASFCKADSNKYTLQERLKEIKVTLLGIGGLGSHLLYDLAALGVHNVRAVDFDKIELSNLNRQILYSEIDIGKNKVDAAKERINRFFPNEKFEFISKKLKNAQDIKSVINGSDLVICVADKPKFEMQKWLNQACVELNIPFITGGLDVNRAVLCTIIPKQTGCIECWKKHTKSKDRLAFEILQSENFLQISDIPMPAIVPLVSTLTGLMLSEFIKLATNISKPQSLGKLLAFSFDELSVKEAENWHRQANCTICA